MSASSSIVPVKAGTYLGRVVAVAKTKAGRNAALYRVSSRSFPNRRAVPADGAVVILPREGAEDDAARNPYVSYNAVRIAGQWAVAANGAHADPIAEKLAGGAPPKDALALTLLTMDYERDHLRTPRIAAVVPVEGDEAWLSVVRADGLQVQAVRLEAGAAVYLATYEASSVTPQQRSEFDAADAADAAQFAIEGGAFAAMPHPVTSAAALADPPGFALGTALA